MSDTTISEKKISIPSKSIEEDIKETKDILAEIKADSKEQRSLVVFGLIVVVIMVATIVVMLLLQYIASYNAVLEKVITIQTQLNNQKRERP